MTRLFSLAFAALAWVAAAAVVGAVGAAEPDLAGYVTVDKVIPLSPGPAKPAAAAPRTPAYLGVCLAPAADGTAGTVAVADVADDSPAARAGIRPGDCLARADGRSLKTAADFADWLRGKGAGDAATLGLVRDGKAVEARVVLAAPSRPLSAPSAGAGSPAPPSAPAAQAAPRAYLGVQVEPVKNGEGLAITEITPGSPAEKAKLKAGEVLLKLDDVVLDSEERLRQAVATRKPDDPVTLTLMLADKAVQYRITLGGPPRTSEGRPIGWDRTPSYWAKPVYRVALIGVEYPDVKHNPKIPPAAWEEAMFSRGTYAKTSVTGQPVYGSLADYYHEQSFGKLKVEGKAFPYVEVSKKRAEYGTGNRTALLTEALDKLLARDGKEALKDFDGVFFVYAGERAPAARGSLYWPHRSSVRHQNRSWPYFICPEGGPRMTNISVFCHEFGHMLGLPDLYARPENPGMEGAGVWCAMANQVGNGRPQHFCAWSKERLGWIQPVTIDPTVKQKIILGPIEESPKECLRIPLRSDGSEYVLVENRSKRKGFDQSLPADGLLIWRVLAGRGLPTLEEAHGIAGAAGPRTALAEVPFPSPANDAFTPFTTPSSRATLDPAGGLPVHVTNIRRLPDGRIALQVGYEYQ